MKESEWRAPVAQLDRASGYGPEGCRFDSYRVHHFMSGGVAQLVEQRTENPCVTGSRPVLATIFFASLPNGHTVRLFYFPDLYVDFQRLAKSEKNGDSPFATISDADSLILLQILRLSCVRDTWIGKVITTWRKRTCENTL